MASLVISCAHWANMFCAPHEKKKGIYLAILNATSILSSKSKVCIL